MNQQQLEDTRTDPPPDGDEAAVLVGFLEFHRETVRRKVAGLDAAQLGQRLAPSTMTLGEGFRPRGRRFACRGSPSTCT